MNFVKRVLHKMKIIIMWLLTGSVAFIFVSGIYKMYGEFKDTGLFDLKKIIVKDEFILSEGQIIELSGIERGVRLMDIDKKYAENRINRSPYIESSDVRLVYPATVVLSVKEKEPMAYLNTKNGLNYIDRDGKIMGKVRPEGSYDLPVINGFENIKEPAKFLSKALDISPFVYHQISELVSTASGLEVYLNRSSARVIIGKSDFDKKIVLLENFIKDEYDDINFDNIDYIDFRFKKQVVLKEITSAN